jgi:hypothetical protein
MSETILAVSRHSGFYRPIELGRGPNTIIAHQQAERVIAAWGPLMRAQDAIAEQRELIQNLRYITLEEARAEGVTLMDPATEAMLEQNAKFYRGERILAAALEPEREPDDAVLEDIAREYAFRVSVGYFDQEVTP